MIKKILLGLLALIVIVVLGFVIYVQTSWDKTYDLAYPDLQVSTDSAVIAMGKYLVHGPAHCSGCHVSSYKDMIRSDRGEPIALKGGVTFPIGPLGTVSPPNLTPDTETGIGRYSDGEIFRMMRHAIKPDGTAAMALMMPFWNMADEDLIAVVSYLRSIEPVRNDVSQPEWTFLGKMVRVMAPTFQPVWNPTPPDHAPPMAPTKERGEYISRYVANCVGCHTPRDQMTYEAIGPEYSGGMEMEPLPGLHAELGIDPDLWTRSSNITPHSDGSFAKFKSLDDWIQRFRAGRVVMNSPMPWGPFSRMSDEDLEALWMYLSSLEPVEHDVGLVVFKPEK